MGEVEEFAEALIDQIGVELNEEREIADTALKISEDPDFRIKFESTREITGEVLARLKAEAAGFTGLEIPDGVGVEFPGLAEFKIMKGRKVCPTQGARGFVGELFEAVSREDTEGISGLISRDTARFLTYSTYAKSYISKITTTYGDYLDSRIYLNEFVLSRYPQIILYKRGAPYEAGYGQVNAAYRGAVKMTVLEELVHSMQGSLHDANREAVTEVNRLNEELAGIILSLGDRDARGLTDYLQLQEVPDDFPIARRANLFFMLNPDNFVMNALGPKVLTFTKVQVDPKIAERVPRLPGIYQEWLGPIQRHESVFAAMEGMAEFCVQGILAGDADFAEYLRIFTGTDITAYRIRKSAGRDFVKAVFDRHGTEAFGRIVRDPPTTKELGEPQAYLDRQ